MHDVALLVVNLGNVILLVGATLVAARYYLLDDVRNLIGTAFILIVLVANLVMLNGV